MSNYTPGPWSIGGKYLYATVLLNAKGESIASGGNNRAIFGEELEASLRLAAAAPDLLNLVIKLEASCEAGMNDAVDEGDAMTAEFWREGMMACRAAIAKATGQQ